MAQNEIALFLAIYGAILSTIAVLWNIRRDIKDKGYTRVGAKPVTRWLMDHAEIPCICVEMANTGKRPVTVIEISYQLGDPRAVAQLSKPNDLPKELGEGQFATVDVMQESIGDSANVTYFIVKDAKGVEHFSRRYPLRQA